MLQKIWPFLFVLCGISGCRGSGPSVTVCILDPAEGTLECGKADGTEFTLPINLIPTNETYVCLDSQDASKLLRYCSKGGE